MAIAITVTEVDNDHQIIRFDVTGLSPTGTYDVMRIISNAAANERRYSLVGRLSDWQPGAETAIVTDMEPPSRLYRLGIWDATTTTPADVDFSVEGATVPTAAATSALTQITPQTCQATLQPTNTTATGKNVPTRIWDFTPVRYGAKMSELLPMGTRFPVIIADRREARRVDLLTLYTRTMEESRALAGLLIPATGRIFPVWLRTGDDDPLLFDDLLFMPGDITIEPASKTRPYAKFFRLVVTELDPRLLPGRGPVIPV